VFIQNVSDVFFSFSLYCVKKVPRGCAVLGILKQRKTKNTGAKSSHFKHSTGAFSEF